MDYDKTEIAASYDKARAFAPETLRLWQDLLSVQIEKPRYHWSSISAAVRGVFPSYWRRISGSGSSA
jgi:hypothetical protein